MGEWLQRERAALSNFWKELLFQKVLNTFYGSGSALGIRDIAVRAGPGILALLDLLLTDKLGNGGR